MVFLKKSCWKAIFLVLSDKMIFLFPENIILLFRTENERWSFSKKYMEIWYFLQMPRKDALSKKIALEYDVSCIIWKDGIFFSGKYDIFSLDGKWKMTFLRKYMEIWYFLYICINVTNMILPLCKKKSTMIFSRKNTLKGDWHSRSHYKIVKFKNN